MFGESHSSAAILAQAILTSRRLESASVQKVRHPPHSALNMAAEREVRDMAAAIIAALQASGVIGGQAAAKGSRRLLDVRSMRIPRLRRFQRELRRLGLRLPQVHLGDVA